MKPFLLLLALVASSATAQRTDTLRTETTTEDARISAAEVKRFIRYITRADVEEKTLVKVGIWPTTDRSEFREFQQFQLGGNFEVAVERKICPDLSILIGVEGFAQYINYAKRPVWPGPKPPNSPDYLSPLNIYEVNINPKIGLRYYYAKLAQIKSGKSANNFSGNYFSVQGSAPWLYSLKNHVSDIYTAKEKTISKKSSDFGYERVRLLLAYGMQRRLGKYAYFDINAGPEVLIKNYYDKLAVSFQLNAFIGFGW